MKLLQTKSQCAVLTALVCLLSLTVLFSCTKAEESDEQAQIKNKKQSVWTEEDLKPKESEVTEDGQPVVMIFGATVNYAQKKQQPTEDTDSETQEEEEVDYGALAEKQALAESGDDGVEVKSHLGSLVETLDRKYYPNLWSIGDRVSINGVSTASLPEANITSGGKQARFPMTQWVEQYNGNWYVGYPADAFSYSAGGGIVTLPVKQTYVAGSYDPDAFIMVGKSDEQGLDFYPQVAPLRITVPGTAGTYYSKIRIEAVAGESLSGTFSTDYNNDEATFTAVSGNSYVEMDTPNLEFGSTSVFFVLPAQTYTRGLRIRVTRSSDGKEMVFSNTKSMTVTVGSMTALTSPTFTPTTAQTTPTLVEVTPSSFYVQWTSGVPANDYAKRWRIEVWTNAACTGDPVRTIEIYPKAGCWETSTTPLRFIVGRMTPGTKYYVKVRDVGNDNSNSTPAEIPLSSAPSTVEMPVSNITTTGVILREDFSEIGWSASHYNGITAGGFYPATSSSSIGQRTFDYLTTDDKTLFYDLDDLYGFSYDRMNTAHESSRLANWLYSGYAYWMPGYIKLGTKNNKGYLFTPAIHLAEGKTAVASVTVKVSKFDTNTSDTWALAVVSGVVPKGNEDHYKRLANSFSLPDASDASLYRTMTFRSEDGVLWTERTFDNLYLSDGDRLVLCLPDGAEYGSSKARINLESLTLTVTELTDDFIIHDATTLDTFRGAVADAVSASESTDITARVAADFSASTIASSWVPIEGYTGTLKGQNHTISGLTQPFFGDLQGTVQNLTLNSLIARTDDIECTAVFAEYLNGTITDCTSKGSVSFCPSTAVSNGTRYVAGMVGWLKTGSMTRCTNEASVTVPHNAQTNNMIVNVGGVMGTINASDITITGPIQNSGNISVGITNSTSAAGSTSFYPKVGGVIGYAKGSSSLILDGLVNRGPVEYNGSSYSDVYVGGIAGHSLWRIKNSTNYGTVTGSGSSTGGSYYYLGGICGYLQKDVQNADNINEENATVTYTGNTSGAVAVVGGLHGYTTGTVKSGSNKAQVKYLGHSGNDFCVGGIVGRTHTGKTGTRVDGVTNYGKVTIAESSAHTGMDAFVGGVVGHHRSGNIMAYNQGAIEITDLDCVTLEAGGLVGCLSNSAGIASGAKNFASGDISISGVTTSHDINAGGLAGYSTGSITGTNEGDVTIESSTVERSIYAAGISAEATASMSTCISNGNVEIKSTVTGADTLFMGGVVGASRAISHTSCYNTGNLTNAAGGRYILIGGVSGFAKNSSWTSCSHRSNTISNTHAADSLICVGGVVGCSLRNSGTVSFTTCYNTGYVSNSGTVHLSSKGVEDRHACVGGLIGRATGVNTLLSTKAAYNYNQGPVGDSSSSDNIDLGGICGFADNASDFTFCRNMAEGVVTVGAGSPRNVYVSGILANADGDDSAVILTSAINNGAINVSGTTISNILAVGGVLAQACGPFPAISGTSSDHTTNNGNITFTGVSLAKALRLGGVWGWRDNTNEGTIEYCTNSGNITANSGGLVTSYNGINAVGGVFGSGGGTYTAVANNLTVQNCQNSGNLYLNFKGCVYMGGIVGGMKDAPNNCSNSGGVSLDRSAYTTTTNSDVGGIVGYTRGGSRTFVNLHNTGNINTKTTNYSYAGGIIGYTNGASTFKACSVAGTITCSSHNPGLFYTVNGAQNVSFSDGCTVKSGTKLVSGGTTTTISSIGDITQTNIVGGGGTSTSLDALGDITVN